MPAYLILDPKEDTASLRAKLETADRTGVIIVAPRDVEGLRNLLLLRFLERFLAGYPGRARLVAQNQGVRSGAASLGIKTLSSLRGSDLSSDDVEAVIAILREQKRSTYWLRANPFIPQAVAGFAAAIIFALILLPFGLLLPSATITIPIAAAMVEAQGTVKLVDSSNPPISDSSLMPAERVEVSFGFRLQARTGTPGGVPAGSATGPVSLVNRGSADITVRKGTVLFDILGARFLTREDVAVPAGGQAPVQVYAETPGVAGNVDQDSISRFEDPALGATLAVTNSQSLIGGAAPGPTVVTGADQDQLRALAVTTAVSRARATLEAEAGADELLIVGSIASGVVAERFDKALGDVTDILTLDVDAVAAGWIVSQSDLDQYAADVFAGEGDSVLIPGSERGEIVSAESDVGGEEVTLHLRVSATKEPTVDVDELRSEITGTTRTEAATIIRWYVALRSPPKIVVEPDFFGSLPWFGWRIDIEVIPN